MNKKQIAKDVLYSLSVDDMLKLINEYSRICNASQHDIDMLRKIANHRLKKIKPMLIVE